MPSGAYCPIQTREADSGEMVRRGRASARVVHRALVLQQLAQGQTAAQVGLNLSLSSKAVRAIADVFAFRAGGPGECTV